MDYELNESREGTMMTKRHYIEWAYEVMGQDRAESATEWDRRSTLPDVIKDNKGSQGEERVFMLTEVTVTHVLVD